jgi:ABC-type transport system involved in multi-copper enzyme maturation permease subunit
MTFLPIVERELRVAARRKATTWTRFFAALTVLVVGGVLLTANERHLSAPYVGKQLFMAVSILAFGFALLAGIFLTADCLCSERRDGTLGLLFLTDLRGYDVVLGKLVATSIVAAYALLAVVPVLGLPLLMGGTDAGEFLRMVLVLGLTLLLSLATGMLASARCRDTKSAMFTTFGVMLALTGGLFLLGWGAALLTRRNLEEMEIILRPSPIDAFSNVDSNTFGMPKYAAKFWSSISWLAGLAFGQLALASWLLPRSWQQGQVEKASRGKAKPWRSARPARGIPDFTNPFGWLAGRDAFPGKLAWLGLAVLCTVWIGFFIGAVAGRRSAADRALITCMFMAFGMHTIVKGMMAVQASRRLCEDRRSGALELLLVTPLPIESILDGHWRALRRQFRPLLWMLTLMNLLLVIAMAVFSARQHMPEEIARTFTTMFVGGIGLLLSDCRAIGWVGMRLGVRGLRHHRAVLGTLARVVLPPWVLIFLFIFMSIGGRAGPDAILAFFCVWTVISLGIGQAQAQKAKEILTDCLRQLAAGDAVARALPIGR